MSNEKKSKIIGREVCLTCQSVGEDSSGDNLAVYDDGHKYCFACGFVEGQHILKKDVIAFPKQVMSTSIVEKCIGEKACDAWDIVEEYVKVRGKGQVGTGTIIYPYYNNEKKLVGLKHRNFETEKETGEKDVFYEGEIDLFGWHMVTSNHDEVIIWEGETDTLNGWQQGSHVANLGLPGTGTAENLIRKNAMALRRFKKIFICLDNDESGRQAKKVISELLPAHITFDVPLPSKYKDFTEAAQDGEAPAVYRKMLRDAVPFSLEDLITGEELKAEFLEYIKDGKQFQGLQTGSPALDKMLSGGLHLAEVVLIVGHTGRGKSTFTAHIARRMAEAGYKIMWVGTEMFPMQMMRKFMEDDLGRRFLWNGDKFSATEEEINESLDRLTQSLVFYNNISGDFDRLERSIVTAVHQHNISVVFIDVLSDIEVNFSDWQVASDIMQRIVGLSIGDPADRRPPVGIVCCVHTKGEESPVIDLSDIRGGAAVRQKATCIIAFEGDVDDTLRTLKVLKKSRMYDTEVLEGAVEFDTETRRYRDASITPEEEPDAEKPVRSSHSSNAERGRRRLGLRREVPADNVEVPARLPTLGKTNPNRGERQSKRRTQVEDD